MSRIRLKYVHAFVDHVAARRFAEIGCSANEIAAWTGQSLREVERYTRAADQARLARNALERVGNHNRPNTSTRHPLIGSR